MAQHSWVQWLGSLLNRSRHAVGFLWLWEARWRGVRFEGRAVLYGRPIITLVPGSTMILGDGVNLTSATRANPLGIFQPCVLRTLGAGAELVLEKNVGMSGTVVCAGRSVRIGEGTILGSGAMVIDNDFHSPEGEWGWSYECVRNARPIVIGRGVFIGTRAIVLKGVTVGDRAIVGAGAVVSKDVPAGHVAVGNPAKVFLPRRAETNPAGETP